MIISISLLAIAMASTVKSQKHVKYSVLAIEYIGESDKPVTPIVISDSKAGPEWYRNAARKKGKSEFIYEHVVDISLLEKLIADADSHQDNVQQVQEKNLKHSRTVAVTIVTPLRRNTLLYDTESAVSLLGNLQMDFPPSSNSHLPARVSHHQRKQRGQIEDRSPQQAPSRGFDAAAVAGNCGAPFPSTRGTAPRPSGWPPRNTSVPPFPSQPA